MYFEIRCIEDKVSYLSVWLYLPMKKNLHNVHQTTLIVIELNVIMEIGIKAYQNAIFYLVGSSIS